MIGARVARASPAAMSGRTDRPPKPKPKPEENAVANVNKWMIDPRDAVLLLIDHQSGLFQLVKDIELPVLRSNVRGRPGVTSSILRTTPLALGPLPKAEASHGWDRESCHSP